MIFKHFSGTIVAIAYGFNQKNKSVVIKITT